jgi:hypothetical protein
MVVSTQVSRYLHLMITKMIFLHDGCYARHRIAFTTIHCYLFKNSIRIVEMLQVSAAGDIETRKVTPSQ